jgi:hypothetical protein
MAEALHIYRTRASGTNAFLLERLDVTVGCAQDGSCITFAIEQPKNSTTLFMTADCYYNGRPLGRVDLFDWIISYPRGPWRWFVTPIELEHIEQIRRGQGLQFALRCQGLALVNKDDGSTAAVAAHGGETVRVEQSAWEKILLGLKYQPAANLSLPLSISQWPEWSRAVNDLQGGVQALSRGETHTALRACLSTLERLHSAPYTPESWDGFFDVDEQKEAGLRELLSGVAKYLNKVGHHRSRTQRDAANNLTQSSVDHYEAEILVAITQLLLTYVGRLPRKAPTT